MNHPAIVPTDRRIAVVGDVGGHRDELERELVRLGADPDTGRLPDDLIVIQVGDLVHRGPDSAGVVAMVDRYVREQPDQWFQLIGNHEAQYLREKSFAWPETLDEDSAAVLRRWWADGVMLVAAVVTDLGGEDLLITHAGVTEGFWRRVLGAPETAERTALVLNAMRWRRDDLLFRSGQVLGGGRPNLAAGPLWASASTELLPGWLDGWLPFSQVHGHTSLVRWSDGAFLGPSLVSERTVVDLEARHETTTLLGGRIVGVDPGHDAEPRGPWRAWEP
ncbi:MAG TPA: metallophosphoesterase [Microlunatus sp.]|nr:metallophosphoesterase [Microlunatus sp.]